MRSLMRLLRGAGLLNILGMSIAFATIYVILVQVNYEWNFNRGIKDSDRIFALTRPSWFEEGKFTQFMLRPLAEAIISQSHTVESYGMLKELSTITAYADTDGNQNKFEMNYCGMTMNALNLFNFKAISGSFEGMDEENNTAISRSAAEKFNLKIGDFIKFDKESNKRNSIVAIFEDLPQNSILGNIDMIECYLTENID